MDVDQAGEVREGVDHPAHVARLRLRERGRALEDVAAGIAARADAARPEKVVIAIEVDAATREARVVRAVLAPPWVTSRHQTEIAPIGIDQGQHEDIEPVDHRLDGGGLKHFGAEGEAGVVGVGVAQPQRKAQHRFGIHQFARMRAAQEQHPRAVGPPPCAIFNALI